MSNPDATPSAPNSQPRRERSTRYPGVNLSECLKFCESIDNLGLDGMSASAIAAGLGYKNIKTNTFSARLSSARQFGLLNLAGDRYNLSPLARAILQPVEPGELSGLYRQALLKPPLYAELAERLAGKRVPDATILGNVLYHNHQIIISAKQAAAEAFLESAQFAGALGADQVLSLGPVLGAARSTPGPTAPLADAAARPPSAPAAAREGRRLAEAEVRLDLQLWDADEGKTIRIRAPQAITSASFERLLQALRLLVRIQE